MIVCTLCSCYPGAVLGDPPAWYKSFEYRSRVVREPRAVLAEFGMQTQGWTEEEVRQQVLTPLEDSSLLGTAHADPRSIMCYQIPGSLTKDGKPIVGGTDIDTQDRAFAAKVYPKKVGANA